MQVQRANPHPALQEPAHWGVELWRSVQEPKTLAALTGVAAFEAARTFGNFSTSSGIYHGTLAGIAALLAVLCTPLVALGNRSGFRLAAIFAGLSAGAAAIGGWQNLPQAIPLGILTGFLALHPTFLGKEDLPTLMARVKNPGFAEVLAIVTLGAPMGLAALSLTVTSLNLSDPDLWPQFALGVGLGAIAIYTFGRKPWALVLTGLGGLGLAGVGMLWASDFIQSRRFVADWLFGGVWPTLALAFVVWSATQLMLDARAVWRVSRLTSKKPS